ncbi:MAG: hypothetical protein M3P49_05555, partial [Actinomycetota bacterium]|nr:hypothetical protein [Actinomycetota bacterium]
ALTLYDLPDYRKEHARTAGMIRRRERANFRGEPSAGKLVRELTFRYEFLPWGWPAGPETGKMAPGNS